MIFLSTSNINHPRSKHFLTLLFFILFLKAQMAVPLWLTRAIHAIDLFEGSSGALTVPGISEPTRWDLKTTSSQPHCTFATLSAISQRHRWCSSRLCIHHVGLLLLLLVCVWVGWGRHHYEKPPAEFCYNYFPRPSHDSWICSVSYRSNFLRISYIRSLTFSGRGRPIIHPCLQPHHASRPLHIFPIIGCALSLDVRTNNLMQHKHSMDMRSSHLLNG